MWSLSLLVRGFALEHNGSVTHATRGRNGRQEGRERGYYHLHRNLNESLFHSVLLFIVTQIFTDLHRFHIPPE